MAQDPVKKNGSQELFDPAKNIAIIIGAPLQIQIEGFAYHLKGYMVGLEPEEYLIVKTPDVGYLKFTPGKSITVRFVHRGRIMLFRSQWIGSISNPKKLIFLEYPDIHKTSLAIIECCS